jgi:hypothetical protein
MKGEDRQKRKCSPAEPLAEPTSEPTAKPTVEAASGSTAEGPPSEPTVKQGDAYTTRQ